LDELDFPQPVIDALKEDGFEKLNPPQDQAVKKGLLKGTNLVIAAPTASGKTLIAEIAILKRFLENKKSVYLVPLRALASEKFEDFTKKYKKLGMRIAVSTGDYDSSDEWLGNYDLVILSNEKMDSLLRHSARWIKDISLIVADEIHLLNDVARGPTLEVVLTKLRQMTDSQILALSATIQNADEISEWLGADLVYSDYRPIELHKGVFYPTEKYYLIDFLTKTEQKIPLSNLDGEIALCLDTLKKKKQSLIFVSTRRNSEAAAEKISESIGKYLDLQEKNRLNELSIEVENALSNPTKQCKRLARILKGGVAFHHAGLVARQRKIIEDNFRSGLIKFIVATPTLAFGVNLPAYRVLIRDVKRYDAFEYGSSYIPIFEIHQFMGRAGRPKYDKEGEAILMAKNSREAEELKSHFLLSDLEPIYSKLSLESVLRMHVLALVASETTKTRGEMERFFSQTFFACQYKDVEDVMEKVEKILEELRSYKFIKFGDEDKFISTDFVPAFSLSGDIKLKATRIGKRVAELYINPLSAKHIIDNIDIRNDLGYLTIINQCAEMQPTLRVRKTDNLEGRLVKMNIKIPDIWDIEYEEFLAAFKTALMLKDWTNELGEDKLLDKYGIAPGELYTKTLNADWLLYGARELALLLNKKEEANHLNKLRLMVKHGVRKELLPLVELRGIGRVRARLLWENRIRKIEDLKIIEKQKLEKLLGPKIATDILAQLSEDRYEKFSRIKARR
jgi:helicase